MGNDKEEKKENKLGKNIKKYRLRKNLSREQVAKEVQTVTSTITRYESGQRIPNIFMGYQLAKVLGCTVEELINSENEEESGE